MEFTPNVNFDYSFHTILCRKSPKTAIFSPQFPPINIFGTKNESNFAKYSQILVLVAGLEPARYLYRRILSPLRLPIPPHKRIFIQFLMLLWNTRAFKSLASAYSTTRAYIQLREIILPNRKKKVK